MRIRLYRWLLLAAAFFLLHTASAQEKSSLLWQISGNGLKEPSYLYGTIHIKDKRVFNFNDSVMPKLREADAFAMEIAVTEENMLKISQAAMLPAGKTLSDFYSKKDYAKLTEFVKTLGYDISLFSNFKPFMLLSVVMNARMRSEMPESVDEHLYNKAKKQKKEILSIETVDEQVKALESMPAEEIMSMVDNPSEIDSQFALLVDAYISYDLAKVQKLMVETSGTSKDSKDFEKKLLEDRNPLMAARIADMAKKQSTFAAIGAGHLPGKEGVIELLRKKGYKVTPIVAAHTPGTETAYEPVEAPKQETFEPEANRPVGIEEEGFSVTFPIMPQQMEQPIPGGGGKVNIYLVQGAAGDNMAYTVSYMDLATAPASKDPKEMEKFYNDMSKQVTDGLGAKLLSQKDINLNGFAGKDMSFDLHGMMLIRSQNYLVGKRFYTVQVITYNGKDNNPEMTAFFNSFQLNK